MLLVFLCAGLIIPIVFTGCSNTDNPLSVNDGSPQSTAAVKPGTWTTLAPIPAVGIGVEGACVAGIGNKIYVAQGHDISDTQTLRIYDISSDTWSYGTPAPGTNSEGAGIAYRGKLFCIGGRLAGPRNDIWAYSPNHDTWDTSLAPMPTARAGLAVARVGVSIYAIGGRTGTTPNSGGAMAVVERYDVPLNMWVTVAPLLSARSDLSACAVGGKIYVFGGFDANGILMGDVDMYDPVTDMWSTAPADLPTPRASLYSVATKGNSVYVIGGWDGIGNGLDTNEAYKVSTDTWTTGLTPMPTPRAEHGMVGHGGRLYVVGGAQPGFGASVVNNEVFKP